MRNNAFLPVKTGRILKGIFLLLIISAWVGPLFGHSEIKRSDSLKVDLAEHTAYDTSWAWIALELGNELTEKQPDSAKYWLEEGVSVFIRQNHYPGISKGLEYGSDYLDHMAQYSQALDLAKRHLNLTQAQKDTAGMANSYWLIGKAYMQMAVFDKAKQSLLTSYDYYAHERDTSMMGRALNAMGNIYFDTKEFEEAGKKYRQAEALFLKTGDLARLSIVTVNISNIYSESLGKPDSALIYLEKALEYEASRDTTAGMVVTLYNIGEVYLDIQNFEKAKERYEQALAVAEHFGDPFSLTTAYQGMGKFYNEIDQPRRALPLLEEALEISEEMQSNLDILYALEDLIVAEKKLGNYEKALGYTERYHMITDSIRSERKLRQIKELSVQYEAEKKEKDLELAQIKEARARQRTRSITWISIVGGLMLLAIVAFLVFASVRQRKLNTLLGHKNTIIQKKNEELESINEQLIELNEEKDVLMGIVAHDLKAPLTKASGLTQVLSLSGELNEEQEKVIGMMNQVFGSGQKLIEELVLIGKLETEGEELSLEECDLVGFVRETAETFRQTAARKSIEIEYVNGADEIPFLTHKEYLGRVLDNLVSNAIKFSQARTKIKLIVEGDETAHRILVRDQGPGIPQSEIPKLFGKFSRLSTRPTAGESSTGLGLYIVKELVEKLNGRIDVQSEVGKGTEFMLEFGR